MLCAEDALYGNRLAEPVAELIVSLAGDYEHIVAPATTDAKNVMPRVAALLDVMVISDASAVVDADTFERPIYAGNAMQTVKSSDRQKGRHLPDLDLSMRRPQAGPPRSKPSPPPATPACPNGSRTRSRPATGPN